jgi:hypothetical protein
MVGTEAREALVMDQLVNPAHRCPECGGREYLFRGRKKVAAEGGQPATVKTKYRCTAPTSVAWNGVSGTSHC